MGLFATGLKNVTLSFSSLVVISYLRLVYMHKTSDVNVFCLRATGADIIRLLFPPLLISHLFTVVVVVDKQLEDHIVSIPNRLSNNHKAREGISRYVSFHNYNVINA